MIQSVVLDLCRRKNAMLDKWVEELFDIDGMLITYIRINCCLKCLGPQR